MSAPGPYKPVKVDAVVQDYMDSLLADLFPDIQDEIESLSSTDVASVNNESYLEPQTDIKEQVSFAQPSAAIAQTVTSIAADTLPTSPLLKSTELLCEPVTKVITPVPEPAPPLEVSIEAPEVKAPVAVIAEPIEERAYPKAPVWAQQSFNVLLFDVCGLKLAVCMESLGRIIKVEKELNQLIGKPSWFMGAYSENEQSLYVVDTAKFIMPEKGYDLTEQGYGFIIQLQRSRWSLACKEVYTTVRLLPDQVKWRSSEGKRPWLAGTVIEHMCALVHVDSLVELFESENS